MENVIVALITGGVTLAGVLLSNRTAQAVSEEKISELTREVREHNHFAQRMPVVEEQLKAVCRRVEALERREA